MDTNEDSVNKAEPVSSTLSEEDTERSFSCDVCKDVFDDMLHLESHRNRETA